MFARADTVNINRRSYPKVRGSELLSSAWRRIGDRVLLLHLQRLQPCRPHPAHSRIALSDAQRLLAREVARYQREHIAPGAALGELDHPSYASEFFRSLNLANVSHQVRACACAFCAASLHSRLHQPVACCWLRQENPQPGKCQPPGV